MSKFKLNFVSNILTQAVNLFSGFIVTVLIARRLGPEKNGYAAYFVLIFTLLANYGHLGISNATSYFQKKSAYGEKKVNSTNLTYLGISFVILSIAIITLRVVGVFLVDYSYFDIALGLIILLFTFFFVHINNLHIGDERISESNRYLRLSKAGFALSIIILFISHKLSVTSYLAFLALSVVYRAIMVMRNGHYEYKIMLVYPLIRAEFSYGLIVYLAALFNYLNYRADQVLVKRVLGDTELGIYTVGVVLAELLLLVPTSMSSALMGHLLNRDKDNSFVERILKLNFYIVTGLCFLGILMTPLIPLVYGTAYKRSIYVVIILFVGIIFSSVGKLSGAYFTSQGKPSVILRISVFSLILNVCLNIVLIPRMGIIGAATASLISYFVYGSYFYAYYILIEKMSLRKIFCFNLNEVRGVISKFKLK